MKKKHKHVWIEGPLIKVGENEQGRAVYETKRFCGYLDCKKTIDSEKKGRQSL